ncbi:MAG: hypothetical protein JXX28_02125 [Deltaproteobacteria bacterium]|nr:hypothetical protein [Deltaproteobacteria bacterium]
MLWLLLLLMACSPPPLQAEEVAERWAQPLSESVARLRLPCAEEEGGAGPWRVLLDDSSGATFLQEGPAEALWVRSPFGVVGDRCWWLPSAPGAVEPIPEQPCAHLGYQDGNCTAAAEVPAGWRFTTPSRVHGGLTQATLAGGLMLGWRDGQLQRLDLSPAYHQPELSGESPRSWNSWLPPLRIDDPELPGAQLAATRAALVAWRSGHLWSLPLPDGLSSAEGLLHRNGPDGTGLLAGSGDRVAVAVEGELTFYRVTQDGSLERTGRLRREALREPLLALLVHPAEESAWVLTEDLVLSLPQGDAPVAYPVPGAEGLLLARPADQPTAYAWGNRDGHGVLYRLSGDVVTAMDLTDPLLAAGIGTEFQELVLVFDRPDGVEVEGWLDGAHLAAMPPGTVGLAMAAFAETPRDPHYYDEQDAFTEAAISQTCRGFEGAALLCCVQGERGDLLARQLDWLDQRLQPSWPGGPAAVVLGINPTAIAQSRWCAEQELPRLRDQGAALPLAAGSRLLAWEEAGTGTAALFIHSQPWDANTWWLRCPEVPRELADPSCWEGDSTPEAFESFYRELAQRGALEPWLGEEPDWTLVGGGYEGATLAGTAGWVGLYPSLPLPDGQPAEDGLYFGVADMQPRIPEAAAKELSPTDAALRVFAVPLGETPGTWDQGGGTGEYHPGVSFALPWLGELQRSGLLFWDFGQYADPFADWTDPAIEGEERPDVMNRADFLALEHYLAARVIAHRDPTTPRWWTFHLQNLSNLRGDRALDNGWVECNEGCAEDTELDRFLLRVQDWGPAVEWRPRP